MVLPVFRECFLPSELAELLCEYYGFSDCFRDALTLFLRRYVPACYTGNYCHLDVYASILRDRLGWSLSKASAFVRCEWPLSLSDKSSIRDRLLLGEVS